jgi:hypothetical protein
VGIDENIVRLQGLLYEFERKSEEVWSRALEHGYDSGNSFGQIATALRQAIEIMKKQK